MRLLLIFMILATGVYVGAFFNTHDPMIAVIAGGIVGFIYLFVLIIITTRPPFPGKLRLLAFAVLIISIGSMTAPFIEGHNTGYWQRSLLLAIRNVIAHGVLQAVMNERSIGTLKAYHDPARPSSETFVQTFDKLNPRVEAGSDVIVDSIFVIVFSPRPKPQDLERLWQYIRVSSLGDSEVILRGVNAVQIREDSIMNVLKIHIQNSMPVLHLSPKGVSYESEQ